MRMKKILVTGINSYIGNSLITWFENRGGYHIEAISVKNDAWKNKDLSEYDVIIHLAGIVHLQEKKKMWSLYSSINCDLTYAVAKKAKKDGVKHFVFMSTKGVYIPNTAHITENTQTTPTKMYGKSKLAGEEKIKTLSDSEFKVSIVRAPTVYGEGCRGNFPRLVKISEKLHIFPRLPNARSMLYIWNLCEFIYRIIDTLIQNMILYPQDKEYCGTMKMMTGLWQARGERYYLSKIMALGIKNLLKLKREGILHTMFTDSVYDYKMSNYYNYEYCVYSFEEAMKKTVEHRLQKKLKGEKTHG